MGKHSYRIKTSDFKPVKKTTVKKPTVNKKHSTDTDEVRVIEVETEFPNIVAEFLGINPKVYEENPYKVQIFIDEAHRSLTSKFEHLRDAPVDFFTEDPRARTLFARFVALCIRTDRSISGRGYELNRNYARINYEKRNLMNYFYAVRYTPPPKQDEIVDIDAIQRSVRNLNHAKFRNRMSAKDNTLNINKIGL